MNKIPKKIKAKPVKKEEITIIEMEEPVKLVEEVIPVEEPSPTLQKAKPVTVQVRKGSLMFEGKRYLKGETFETTKEKAMSIDQQFVKITA